MPRGYGEVIFSLTDLTVATFNVLTGVVGTGVDLPEQQTLEFGFEADTDRIKATGAYRHKLTVITHGVFTLAAAGIPYAALATITNMTRTSSGSAPNRQQTGRFQVGGAGLPYFAIAGKMVGEQGDDLHVGLICCKLDAPPKWKFEQNKYAISECKGECISPYEDDSKQLVYLEAHETAAAINLTTLFA